MTLEQVLKRAYLVGGAVRDELLGAPVTERDWLVVGCSQEDMLSAGFSRLDPEFPVFLHPKTKEEYALARREKQSGDGYRGFVVDLDNVSLSEDLQRRDLTINAMVRDAEGQLIDLHEGVSDLNEGLLRHVTEAFAEDPVRLLRTARFAAQLGSRFRVSHKTNKLMRQMVSAQMLKQISPQRLGREINKAFAGIHPWRFFEVLEGCGGLSVWLPGLSSELSGAAHGEGRRSVALEALQRASQKSELADVRFAVFALADKSSALELLRIADLPKRLTDLTQGLMSVITQDVNTLAANEWCDLFEVAQLWSAGDLSDKRWQVIELLLKDVELSSALKASREAVIGINRESIVDKTLSGKALGDAIKQQKRDTICQMLDEVIQHGDR